MNDYQKSKPRDHIPESESRYAGGGSAERVVHNSNSAGAPIGYNEENVLRKAMKENSRKCFGGKIFRYDSHVGMPMVCHAIPKSYKKVAFDKLSYWYNWTVANSVGNFLVYKNSKDIGDYVCFKFSLNKGARSMREIMADPERAGLCKNLFTDLVVLLHNYSEDLEGGYAPLCAISLDTVYMDARGRLSILPLVCVNNEYPKGFPLEAGTDEMDDTTDLYTAALLTYQVLSGIEYEKPSENKRMKDLKEPEEMVYCMKNCMDLFASKRFSLREVYARLCTDAAPERENRQPGKKNRYPRDDKGNRIYDSDEEEENVRGAGFLTELRRIVYSFFNPDSEVESSRTAGRPDPDRKRKSSKRCNDDEYGRRYGYHVSEDDDAVDIDDDDDFVDIDDDDD